MAFCGRLLDWANSPSRGGENAEPARGRPSEACPIRPSQRTTLHPFHHHHPRSCFECSFRARCFVSPFEFIMSYQYQQPTGESQQQASSGHETPAGESPAPGFNQQQQQPQQQQGSGASQNGSDTMGEKTTLWYVTTGERVYF